MVVGLVCSDQLVPILTELLKNRDITISNSTKDSQIDVLIVESGYDYDQSQLAIVFSMLTIDKLIAFLDSYRCESIRDNESKDSDENTQVISGKSEDGYEILPYNTICYFEGIGNNVYAVNDISKFKIKEKLYELEPKLKTQGFIRISKSFIVNIVMIDRVQPWFNGKLLLKLNVTQTSAPPIELEVTRTYVKDFKTYLGL